MAKSKEELAVDLQRIEASFDSKQYDALASVIGDLSQARSKVEGKKADLTAKSQDLARSLAAKYDTAVNAGSVAAKTRGLVELSKLLATAPVNYAKAAYVPDEKILQTVALAAPNTPGGETADAAGRNRRAWETFYNTYVPGTGNLLGTIREMENRYGKADEVVGLSENDFTRARKAEVDSEYGKALAAADEFENRMRYLADMDGEYARWSAERGLDPNDEKTYTAFHEYYGIQNKLPGGGDTPFVRQLKALANDPKAFSDALYRSDLEAESDALDAQIKKYEGMLPDRESTSVDTDRDKLALWLKREDAQAFGKGRGLQVGTVIPYDDNSEADLNAGKYPGAVRTKYGLYIPGPDDMKAARLAIRDLETKPERRLFRAAGLNKADAVPVEITLKSKGPTEAKIVKAGVYGEGDKLGSVGVLDNGEYVVSKDGVEWKPIDRAAGERLAAATTLEDAQDVGSVPIEQAAGQVVRGVRQRPTYGDPPGSIRYIDSNGKEQLVRAEDIESVSGGDAPERRTFNDNVRRGTYNRVMGREERGGSPDETETPSSPASRPLRAEKVKPEPVVFNADQPAPKPDKRGVFKQTAIQTPTPLADAEVDVAQAAASKPAERPALPELTYNIERPDKGPARIERKTVYPTPEAASTTVPDQTTPTAGLDPRKAAYRKMKGLPDRATLLTQE